jgi:hypothetical protein
MCVRAASATGTLTFSALAWGVSTASISGTPAQVNAALASAAASLGTPVYSGGNSGEVDGSGGAAG